MTRAVLAYPLLIASCLEPNTFSGNADTDDPTATRSSARALVSVDATARAKDPRVHTSSAPTSPQPASFVAGSGIHRPEERF